MIKLELNPAPRLVRQFAWFGLVGLPLIVGFVLRLSVGFSWTHPAMIAAGVLAVVTLVLHELGVPALAKVLFVVISVVALPIGFVISHLLMMVVYYLVLTPIALVMRATGRDMLGKKLEPQRETYWHVREAERPKASYFKLY